GVDRAEHRRDPDPDDDGSEPLDALSIGQHVDHRGGEEPTEDRCRGDRPVVAGSDDQDGHHHRGVGAGVEAAHGRDWKIAPPIPRRAPKATAATAIGSRHSRAMIRWKLSPPPPRPRSTWPIVRGQSPTVRETTASPRARATSIAETVRSLTPIRPEPPRRRSGRAAA